jgi:hypothetical protein
VAAQYSLINTERGAEPTLRTRVVSTDLQPYRITQADIGRIPGFLLATLALKFFGDEDLEWILRDVNDPIKEDSEYAPGDIVNIPADWESFIQAASTPILDPRARSYT